MTLGRLTTLSLAFAVAALRAPVPGALAQSGDPCGAAAPKAAAPAASRSLEPRESKYGRYGADKRGIRGLLQLSSAAATLRARGGVAGPAAVRPAASQDLNDIAILEDNGDLIISANPFDLANRGLRFEPSGSGYSVTSVDAQFRSDLGRAVTLGDDDSSAAQPLGFSFPFYGRRFTSLFVNSDGNLTFEEPDNASTERDLDRLTSGPPRVAAFFADLDPSAGGRVLFNASSDAATITWCGVPGFDSDQTMTVQALLLAAGTIEIKFGSPDLVNGIVGLSPGRTETFTPIDLRQGGRADQGAIGELFATSSSLDLIAATRRFYETHPDNFDQLVFWTDSPVMDDAFAFETTVRNEITGTGLETFDFTSVLGSAGALQSLVNMDRVSKYPDSPASRIFGESSALGILAHETGHRWLAKLLFRNVDRVNSDLLLGRQLAHWSFFMDTDGSVMEGNEIEDQRGGVFRTQSTTEKYSRLDLYAMGLATPAEVPPWFYIDSPISNRTRESNPIAGLTINGTRRDVTIQDVIDALGPREPAAAPSPRVHRQAYVFVRRATAFHDPQDLVKLGRIREQFGPFFSRATENRMTVRTTLAP